jgi:hypothetical protein
MYQQLLQQHLDDLRAYGLSPQPPCGSAALQRLREGAARDLGTELPNEYYEFLKITNGLDSNGLVIYASETSPIAGHEGQKDQKRSIQGVVDANLAWWDFEPHKKFVFFGDSSSGRYVYDVEDKKYRVLDRQASRLVEELPSFEALLAHALERNLP